LGSSPEAEDNAEVKRKQSAEEVGHFVGFRGISWDFVGFLISDSHRSTVTKLCILPRGAGVH